MKIDIPVGWVPSRVLENENGCHIEFADFNGKKLSKSFMREDLASCRNRILIGLEDLVIWGEANNLAHLSEQVAGMIFHMSRCGSTLAANMLRQHRQFQVASEPDILGQFLMTYRGSKEDLTKYIKLLVGLLVFTLCSSGQKLIIKWSSWNTVAMDVINGAVPNAPLCFLHRTPSEILVSLKNNNSEWLDSKLIGIKLRNVPSFFEGAPESNPFYDLLLRSDASRHDLDETTAKIISLCCESAMLSKKPFLLVPYESLPESVFTDISPHFSMDSNALYESMARIECRWNTKSINKSQIFKPDVALKSAALTQKMEKLIDKHIAASYEALLKCSNKITPVSNGKKSQMPLGKPNLTKIESNKKETKPMRTLNEKPVVKWI